MLGLIAVTSPPTSDTIINTPLLRHLDQSRGQLLILAATTMTFSCRPLICRHNIDYATPLSAEMPPPLRHVFLYADTSGWFSLHAAASMLCHYYCHYTLLPLHDAITLTPLRHITIHIFHYCYAYIGIIRYCWYIRYNIDISSQRIDITPPHITPPLRHWVFTYAGWALRCRCWCCWLLLPYWLIFSLIRWLTPPPLSLHSYALLRLPYAAAILRHITL